MLRIILLLATVFLALPVFVAFPVAASTPSATPRIIGGSSAAQDDYPWMVSLELDGDPVCGGSLISSHWVLTAAHCILPSALGRYKVRVGAYDLSVPTQGEERTVDKIIIHPGFSDVSLQDDLALIGFSSAVAVQPVQLASTTDFNQLAVGQELMVAGWGLTSIASFTYPSVLQHVALPLFDHAQCAASYATGDVSITDNMVCAGGGSTDSCFGDSGGPLFQKAGVANIQQIGIVSFGATDSCADGFPGIYTRVDAYTNFISQVTQGWLVPLNLGVIGQEHTLERLITFTNPTHDTLTFSAVTNPVAGIVLSDNTCLNHEISADSSCSFLLTATAPTTENLAGDIVFSTAAGTQLTYRISAQVLAPLDLKNTVDDLGASWFSGEDAAWQLTHVFSLDGDASAQSGGQGNSNTSTLLAYYTGSGTLYYQVRGQLALGDQLILRVFDAQGHQVIIDYPTSVSAEWTSHQVILPKILGNENQEYALVWQLVSADESAHISSKIWLDGLSKTEKVATTVPSRTSSGVLDCVSLMVLLVFAGFTQLRRSILT